MHTEVITDVEVVDTADFPMNPPEEPVSGQTNSEKQGGGEKMTHSQDLPTEAPAAVVEMPKKRRGRKKMTEEQKIIARNARESAKIAKTEPGDNTRFVNKNLELFNLGAVDIYDTKALLDRTKKYFQIMARYDSKPTLSGYAMAIGLDRRRLYEIRTGNFQPASKKYRDLPEGSVIVIRKMYDYLEMMWEDYMLNGKINPVTGIFIAKNQFGYQDRIDYVPNAVPEKEKYDAESIRKRYENLGGDSEN